MSESVNGIEAPLNHVLGPGASIRGNTVVI